MKKGQVTLFVIIAIVAVIMIAGIFYGSDMIQKAKDAGLPDQVKTIKLDTESCLESSAKKALWVTSSQGGYIFPDNYFSDGNFMVGYWFYNVDTSPSTSKMEEELSDLTCILLEDCMNLGSYGIQVTSGGCTSQANIKADRVNIEVNYPLTAVIGDKTYNLEKFSTRLNANMGKVEGVAKEIVREQSSHPDEVCLTCLADVGEANDMLIDVGSSDEGLLVTITDENSRVFDEPYKFKFAMSV